VASRLTALAKGSGVEDDQDDAYASRQRELERQFHALPPASELEYWHLIEGANAQRILPLEVLARCFHERIAAGALADGERIFKVIWRRVQSQVGRWAWAIADRARSGMKQQLREDLEQECCVKLWEELRRNGPTFLLQHFATAFVRLRQHVARDMMEKAGEWPRADVERPTRILRDQMDSLQAQSDGEDGMSLDEQLPERH
jgi:hypothetical protein